MKYAHFSLVTQIRFNIQSFAINTRTKILNLNDKYDITYDSVAGRVLYFVFKQMENLFYLVN